MFPFFSISFLFPSSGSGCLQSRSKGHPCDKKEFFPGHPTDAGGEEYVSPKIREDLIPRSYRLARTGEVPMTRLANQLLEQGIAELEQGGEKVSEPTREAYRTDGARNDRRRSDDMRAHGIDTLGILARWPRIGGFPPKLD